MIRGGFVIRIPCGQSQTELAPRRFAAGKALTHSDGSRSNCASMPEFIERERYLNVPAELVNLHDPIAVDEMAIQADLDRWPATGRPIGHTCSYCGRTRHGEPTCQGCGAVE